MFFVILALHVNLRNLESSGKRVAAEEKLTKSHWPVGKSGVGVGGVMLFVKLTESTVSSTIP